MRIEVLEPFGQYPALTGTAGLTSNWLAGTAWDGVTLGGGFTTNNKVLTLADRTTISTVFIRKVFTAPSRKLTFCFATRINQMGTILAPTSPMHIQNDSGNAMLSFRFNPDHKLVIAGTGVNIVGGRTHILGVIYRHCLTLDYTNPAAAVMTLTTNGEENPEFSVTFDASALANHDMARLYFTVPFRNFNTEATLYTYSVSFGDLILGLDECVEWGPQEIVLTPASADVVSEWTRSAGASNFGTVDEIPGSTADYNHSNTPGQKDIFGFTPPANVPESIVALGMMFLASKEDSATRKIAGILRTGAEDLLTPDVFLSETPFWLNSFLQVNPDTEEAFTPEEYIAITGFGYENRT
jgi:hypothetical protein